MQSKSKNLMKDDNIIFETLIMKYQVGVIISRFFIT